MVREGGQAAGRRGGLACAGQLAAAVDTSGGDEWTVRLLSGAAAGVELSLPRQNLQSYSGELFVLQCIYTHLSGALPVRGDCVFSSQPQCLGCLSQTLTH